MSDINSFKEKLQNLIIKFEKDKHHYLSKDYLEAQVRQDFINPFFEALGWDIENKKGLSPFDREVILEKGETTGRPDYNFRISGSTKFFVEAKAPSVILDNVHHILQAKTCAYSTKEVYFVILTDFEGFKLFDASLKPSHKFPGEGLIFDFKYTEYLENIDKLWLLSIEEVERGSLEKLLPRDVKSKRLRIPVDRALLLDMTEWRTGLAKDIHKRNPELDVRLLNEVVQRLLDRVIFIRIAEDRKIRNPYELKEIVDLWRHENKRKPILTHLNDLFREINDDLNGDIFKPHACETIDVDSDLLADIIENLYFPKCRYRFDVIGVELLGSIYERYLGSTIRVTPQRIKVEEKLEVRKAGGVYYTPKYIVDYIVKNTVGRLIEGKTPKQIEKFKILDPACGSGSFLLGAYQYLLNYHLEYFRKHPKLVPAGFKQGEAQNLSFDFYHKAGPDDLSLPLHIKANILKNNIFGVDIDPQAVEITMMSLYLKLLEGERSLLPRKQHILPSLTNNIKCGNSLIGYDIFDSSTQYSLSAVIPAEAGIQRKIKGLDSRFHGNDDETKSRINPFDWNSKIAGFGEIMNPSHSPLEKGGSKGGFDVVIGNPPYVRIQAMKEWAPVEVEFYKKQYCSTSKGNYDIYVVFVEKGLNLLNPRGYLGFILPHKFFQSQYGEPLRNIISKGKHLSEIVYFGDKQIFEWATTYTCLMFLDKTGGKQFRHINASNLVGKHISLDEKRDFQIIPSNKISKDAWNFQSLASNKIIEKLKFQTKLVDITKKIFKGSSTGNDDIYLLQLLKERQKTYVVFSKQIAKEIEIEKELLKPFLFGSDIRRYGNLQTQTKILFPYEIVENKANLILLEKLKKEYPLTFEYLMSVKSVLVKRKIKLTTNDFYKFSAARSLIEYTQPKIVIPDILVENRITIDLEGQFYHGPAIHSIIFNEQVRNYSLLYFLSILNSKLFWFHLTNTSTALRGNAYRLIPQFLEPFPIKLIDFNTLSEKAIHDRLVSLVDRMLELHKKKNSMPPSAEREKVEREIAVTDEKIDDIVYGLYGITEGERKIIEGEA